MTLTTEDFVPGGYRYIPGPFQYSGGVAALTGFHIERVRFHKPVPVEEGFQRIEAHIQAAGRPMTSFCACELRSPAPFDDAGFIAFNRVYVGTLERWGIFKDDVNPVARSNVCPKVNPPAEPSFHAFAYTREGDAEIPTFITAGSAESQDGPGEYKEKILRYQDTSPAGIRAKAEMVLDRMEERMEAFGRGWADATAVQIYTVHDIHPFLEAEIARRGAARPGLSWHYCRPPVIDLEYEMDVRAVADERVTG